MFHQYIFRGISRSTTYSDSQNQNRLHMALISAERESQDVQPASSLAYSSGDAVFASVFEVVYVVIQELFPLAFRWELRSKRPLHICEHGFHIGSEFYASRANISCHMTKVYILRYPYEISTVQRLLSSRNLKLSFSIRFLASIHTSKVKSNSLILPSNTADMQLLSCFWDFLRWSSVLRICLAIQRIRVQSLIGELRSHMMGFPHGSNDKESACNAGDPGLIPGSGLGMATHSSTLGLPKWCSW